VGDLELGNGKRLDRIAGRNPVLEALAAGRRIERILLAKGAKVDDVQDQAARRGVPVEIVDRHYLDALVKTLHQGVVAFAEALQYASTEDILDAAKGRREPAMIVALDQLEDPQNLGSILRSSDAFGVHGVIILERRSVSLSPAVSRASAGAVEHVRVARIVNMARELENLKRAGLWVIGLDGAGDDVLWTVDLTSPVVIVVGGEGRGLRRLVKEKCDVTARIPMAGRVSSLNAGVAAALALYEAQRQRNALIRK